MQDPNIQWVVGNWPASLPSQDPLNVFYSLWNEWNSSGHTYWESNRTNKFPTDDRKKERSHYKIDEMINNALEVNLILIKHIY